jgi:hypoxanthine phosphoribosyltransferase
MNYRSYQDLSDDIKSNIYKLEKYNIDLVVGIPRSGMIPAYMISLILNVNCTDFHSFIENRHYIKAKEK